MIYIFALLALYALGIVFWQYHQLRKDQQAHDRMMQYFERRHQEFQKYRAWVQQQSCVTCGTTHNECKLWFSEIQCSKCYFTQGAPTQTVEEVAADHDININLLR